VKNINFTEFAMLGELYKLIEWQPLIDKVI
jgi:hypothetical protein